MRAARQRLLAQFGTDPVVELHRAQPGVYITEGCIRSLTEQMTHGWRHWVEQPMNDSDAIGRRVSHTPDFVMVADGQDSDLEVEVYPAPAPFVNLPDDKFRQ